MDTDEWQLLNEYSKRNSEQAFRTLVERYAGIAYHAALSRSGNPHYAEEITQAVFIALARKAGRIPRGTVLSGWIFQATRFAALNLEREEARRRHYEQEASMPDSMNGPDDTESIWERIAPRLYEAMDKLSSTDRDALLIRFFQNKSHKEVGQALGVSEDAAKARVSRAIERLRMMLANAGLVTPSSALVAALSAQTPVAPAGLTGSVTAAAMKFAPAHSAFSFAAWMHGKAAVFASAAVLLAAVGIATITVKAVNAPVADIVGRLEKQSGEIVISERRLNLPVTFNIQGLTLPEALDRLATRAGAYWTVDYAIYDSKSALERLEEGLREVSALDAEGWTNLSHAPHTISPIMVPHAPGMSFAVALRIMPNRHSSEVKMFVDLAPEASAK